jgi:hypothetical protein
LTGGGKRPGYGPPTTAGTRKKVQEKWTRAKKSGPGKVDKGQEKWPRVYIRARKTGQGPGKRPGKVEKRVTLSFI